MRFNLLPRSNIISYLLDWEKNICRVIYFKNSIIVRSDTFNFDSILFFCRGLRQAYSKCTEHIRESLGDVVILGVDEAILRQLSWIYTFLCFDSDENCLFHRISLGQLFLFSDCDTIVLFVR